MSLSAAPPPTELGGSAPVADAFRSVAITWVKGLVLTSALVALTKTVLVDLLSLYLMSQLSWLTWLRFFLWMSLGLVIYFGYSRKASALAA